MYKYQSKTWQKIWRIPEQREVYLVKKMAWRRGGTVKRVKRPSRLDKARHLGYKAKQGYVVTRVRVSRGGLRKISPALGRRQKRMGITKIKRGKSIQQIAEERAKRKYPNLTTLGSYFLGEDGRYTWFDVVMIDEHHPSVRSAMNRKK